jgi:hypothetical protein
MGHRFWGRTRALFTLITGVVAAVFATAAIAFDEEDLFLLDIQADGYLLAESVAAYKSGKHYLIDFPAFLEAVEFPIRYREKVWSGWFRAEERKFVWNTDSEIAEITGQEGVHVDILQWIENSEGFFVSTDMLGVWFDLQLAVDPRLQVVTLSSDEPLPFQEWKQRTLAQYRYRAGEKLDADALVPDQYHWLTMPLFNLNTQVFTQEQSGERSYSSAGSLVAGMDLLKHSVMYTGTLTQNEYSEGILETGGTSTASATNSTHIDSTHRLTIERAAATRDSTLFAGATRYMLGDIYQGASNLVVNADTGRGFSIGRFAEGYTGNLSLVTIVGDAPPGWQVELYRNDALIEFGAVGRDGRYIFPDQEVPFGENIFVAKLFGPQGQTREDRQVFWGGGMKLAEGDYDYSVSHIDFDQSFIDGSPANADALPASYATDFRVSRGWTENIQAGVGFTHAGLGSQDRDGTYTDSDYLSLFGRMKLGPGVLISEGAAQLDAGEAWSLEYLTGFNGHNISIAHRAFNGYVSPATVHGEALDAVNDIAFFGPLGHESMSSYTLRLRQRDKADGTSDFRIFNRLGTRLGPVSLSNDLEYIASNGPSTANGQFRIAGRVRRVTLRGQLDYQLYGDQTLRQISASMNWDFTSRLTNNLIVTKNLADDKSFFFTNLLSARIGNFDLTFSASSDFDDYWQIGAGFNISFGYDRRRQGFVTDRRGLANTGRAAMNLFIDENNNGIREPDEAPVPWVTYRNEEMLSAVPGTVSLHALPRYRPVKIETSDFKFDDPFLVPRKQVYELYTHAGSDVSVDVAVVMTGDIEGYVLTGTAEKEIPVRGIIVALYDANGREIAAARSEFDGFYNFTGIPAGNYEVRVKPKTGENLLAQAFTLDGEDGYVVLDKIFVHQ